MPLHLDHFAEADLETFTNIQFAAFNSGMMQLFTPQPAPPSRLADTTARNRAAFLEDKRVHFLKVTDTDTGAIISVAKWEFFPDGRSEEEVNAPFPEPKEDSNVELERDFFAYLGEGRRGIMGTRPFAFLHILATHPDHHRRGAGAMLVHWGCDEANRLGLPAYLEASKMGRPLYERFGFEVVKEVVFDLAKYGGQGTEANSYMVRPKKAELE